MKYAETGQGNYADDDSLKAIEDEEGFGIPGQSAIGTVGVNTGGPDGSDTHFNAGESGRMVDLQPPDAETPFEQLGFNPGFGGNKMHVEGPSVGDLAPNEIVKEEVKTSSVEDYLSIFHKTSNDSKLYYQGYNDAMAGKELDEDLALLSDDYYNGYEQYKFYNKSNQQSVGTGQVQDIKPNSNALRGSHPEADAGPLQLTAARKLASIYPIDVIQKFFEV